MSEQKATGNVDVLKCGVGAGKTKSQGYDVLVAAGTTEAHDAIEVLQTMGFSVAATVATDLGSAVLDDLKKQGVDVYVGRKDADEFCETIRACGVRYVVDATHPFAVDVTKTVKSACEKCREDAADGFPKYIRYVRRMEVYDYDKIIYVKDAAGAAKELQAMTGNFLLTTGANTVNVYKDAIKDFNVRGFVRVLNTKASIDRCRQCGVEDAHVIAKNPPFSAEDNIQCIKDYHICVIVSKDSGQSGGLFEKIESAKIMGIPMILIERPMDETGVSSKEELKKWIEKL